MLVSDVIRFLTVFSVFLVAFAQAFFILFAHDGFVGFITSVQTCFLAMLGDFVFDDFTNSYWMMVSVGLLVTYVVVVTVLLLNLLIAMMGDVRQQTPSRRRGREMETLPCLTLLFCAPLCPCLSACLPLARPTVTSTSTPRIVGGWSVRASCTRSRPRCRRPRAPTHPAGIGFRSAD